MNISTHVIGASGFWSGRRVLVTGHTGFKGAWLWLWLESLGARLCGVSGAPPSTPSLFELARAGGHHEQHALDVRDAAALARALASFEPEVVFHLAAQPLVGRSLRDPLLTYEVNVLGTANLLEAARRSRRPPRAVVVVSSDKCYAQQGGGRRRHREEDPLGGRDPYASSKACAELLTAAWRDSLLGEGGTQLVASARAGNVIGGGDWGEGRLLADCVRAVEAREPLLLRRPEAVRPWQHVLNALCGYLLLARALWEGRREAARAWNFGPAPQDEVAVGRVVERLRALWAGELSVRSDPAPAFAESDYLALDSTAAERELGWLPPWGLEHALELTVAWHRARREGADPRRTTLEQIERFVSDATGSVRARL